MLITVIIVMIILCCCISVSIGVYMFSSKASEVPEVGVPSPPSLLEDRIQYQGRCDGNGCSNLNWTNVGMEPWNKYYKFTCFNNKKEESLPTEVFGPVSLYGWKNPKIRLQSDGVNPCGKNSVRIYRGNDAKNLSPITLINYNNKDATFTDMN